MKLLYVMVGTLLLASIPVRPAVADIPDPFCNEVHPADAMNGVVLAPTGAPPVAATVLTVLTVIVRNGDCIPIDSATVVVTFPGAIGICSEAVHTGTTAPNGTVTITLRGGGCHSGPLGCVIKANGVTIRDYENAKSPDYDGSGPDGTVNLADLIAFAGEFLSGGSGCHDYTNDGSTDLGDLIIFAEAFVGGWSCALIP